MTAQSVQHSEPQLEGQSLPGWLGGPTVTNYVADLQLRRQARAAQRQLDEITYEALFDEFLDAVRENGLGVRQLFDNDPRAPDLKRFVAWVMRDENRKAQYYEAQAIGAEVLMIETPLIADASDSMEDVNRSTLRVNTRKWQMSVWNRKRFGDVKQIDQNVTIDLSGAMQQAQERLDRSRTIDADVRRISAA
jgi:hypothetical protein